MDIHIVAGTGSGPTKLAAFDAALNEAGIANYNLIPLSSVVPPGSKIISVKQTLTKQPGQWGDKLYVVKADIRVDSPNVEAWAGIGWVQDSKTGKGLFVEHEGANEQSIRRDIRASLEALMAVRKKDFGPIHMKVIGKTCLHEPVCALVVAVYQASGWKTSLKTRLPGLHKS